MPECGNCKGHESTPVSVPYVVHEGIVSKMERQCKRLWIVAIIAILALFASNAGWLIYESQFETVYYDQDSDGINNVNSGTQGDLTYEPEGQG